jgi:hypothetical protein
MAGVAGSGGNKPPLNATDDVDLSHHPTRHHSLTNTFIARDKAGLARVRFNIVFGRLPRNREYSSHIPLPNQPAAPYPTPPLNTRNPPLTHPKMASTTGRPPNYCTSPLSSLSP